MEHIIRQRMRKDAMTEEEANTFVRKRVPEILANGKLTGFVDTPSGRRAIVDDQTGRIVLSLDRLGDKETWIVTGFERYK